MKIALIFFALAAVPLAGSAAPNGTRIDPIYEEAARKKFVALNQLAIATLVDGFK